MSPARMVTLFSDERLAARDPYSFFFSAFLHGLAGAGLITLLMKTPQIIQPHDDVLYAVRLVKINTPDKEQQSDVADALFHALHRGVSESPGSQNRLDSSPAVRYAGSHESQLLLQSAAPSIVIPKDVVPNLIILSPHDLASKHVAAAEPQKEVAADLRPVLEIPNEEAALDEVQIASSAAPSENLKLRTTTVAPMANHRQDDGQQMPQTHSVQAANQPAGSIISISDVHLAQGEAAIPHVNSPGEGPQKGTTPGGAKAPNQSGESHGAIAEGMSSGSQSGSSFETTRISLPKNGRFSMVVVGDSIGDQYPETNSVWNGRLAYTVYLHVGLSKSWIMQYTRPEPAGQFGSTGSGRIDAPWPVDMVIPHLNEDSMRSDALIVRGLVNAAGHFENLSMVFPSDYAQTNFVLHALRDWVFRPATLNGAPVATEILIIIPEQD